MNRNRFSEFVKVVTDEKVKLGGMVESAKEGNAGTDAALAVNAQYAEACVIENKLKKCMNGARAYVSRVKRDSYKQALRDYAAADLEEGMKDYDRNRTDKNEAANIRPEGMNDGTR